ncbi:MAG: hypothetical protein AAB332_00555 [Planctomycetota bacterium]
MRNYRTMIVVYKRPEEAEKTKARESFGKIPPSEKKPRRVGIIHLFQRLSATNTLIYSHSA